MNKRTLKTNLLIIALASAATCGHINAYKTIMGEIDCRYEFEPKIDLIVYEANELLKTISGKVKLKTKDKAWEIAQQADKIIKQHTKISAKDINEYLKDTKTKHINPAKIRFPANLESIYKIRTKLHSVNGCSNKKPKRPTLYKTRKNWKLVLKSAIISTVVATALLSLSKRKQILTLWGLKS